MGRKSNLTAEQWAAIGKRLIAGEGASAIARDLTAKGIKVTESTIRTHFRSAPANESVPAPANEVVVREIRSATTASELAENLRAMALTYTRAANIGASTALRCISLANTEMTKVDDADPASSEKRLKTVAILSRMAIDALDPARSLLMASGNRELLQRAIEEGDRAAGEELTPERLNEGARRLAFVLHRAAHMENS